MSPVRTTPCPPTECVPWSARSPPWTPQPTRLATVPLPDSLRKTLVSGGYGLSCQRTHGYSHPNEQRHAPVRVTPPSRDFSQNSRKRSLPVVRSLYWNE